MRVIFLGQGVRGPAGKCPGCLFAMMTATELCNQNVKSERGLKVKHYTVAWSISVSGKVFSLQHCVLIAHIAHSTQSTMYSFHPHGTLVHAE